VIYGIWEAVFLGICLISLILGISRGGLRSLTFFSAHLFPCVLALVFSPWAGALFTAKTSLPLNSLFFVFLVFYLIPMILLTQLFRMLYFKKIRGAAPGKLKGGSRLAGIPAGLLAGAFFSLLLTWLLLLQPWIALEKIYALGGTVFTYAAEILQIFMRFYV